MTRVDGSVGGVGGVSDVSGVGACRGEENGNCEENKGSLGCSNKLNSTLAKKSKKLNVYLFLPLDSG